ncbi:MAG: thioesterase [Bacteroidales bacterium]|nr:thioesterase [Bacteroidales bacterium]
MENVGTYNFVTESYLVDFQGEVPIPMLGNYMLHAAAAHAEERGFGYADMTRHNLAWVLSRIDIQVDEYPRMSEPIAVQTWVEDVNRLFTSRCFAVLDREGREIVHARSVWAAIDLTTRRPSDLMKLDNFMRFICDKKCPISKSAKVPHAEDAPAIQYQVKYSDLDINKHLNSIKYMEHLLDLFDIEKFRKQKIRRFEILYLAEGKYGMNLSLHLKRQEDTEQYIAAICDDTGKAICRAAITWE